MEDGAGVGSSFARLVTLGIYVTKWGVTQASLLMKHSVAYEWGFHTFPPTTIDVLELL